MNHDQIVCGCGKRANPGTRRSGTQRTEENVRVRLYRPLLSVLVVCAGLLGLVLGVETAHAQLGPTEQELDNAQSNTRDWLYATHDYSGQRFVNLKQITPANARRVQAVCIWRATDTGPAQTNPVVYRGVMYLSVARSIVTVDAKTCRQLWKYTWEPKGKELSPTNRGVTIKDGKVIRGTADGYLIAVDMARGTLLWSQKIADSKNQQYLSMPPLIYEDLVIYGPAGVDFGQKAWVGAFNLENGEQIWKFNLIPDPGEPGAETWENPDALKYGGGNLWTPLSFDSTKGILYLPVGNPAAWRSIVWKRGVGMSRLIWWLRRT